jgi:tRNA(fMet)-specific endonuclease VapC
VNVSHVLDTDVCIEVLRRRDRRLLARLAAAPGVAVSAITLAELDFGARRSADPAANLVAVETFTALVVPLPFDGAAAREAGKVRSELARIGRPIGPFDVLIAGHALSVDLPLVTRNGREFRRVPDLVVERW